MDSRHAPSWDHDFARRSPIFAPLVSLADKLPAIGWPNTEILNHLADESGRRIVNARGERLRFMPPSGPVSGVSFEAGTFLRSEVPVRPIDWHDLLNALVWITFPTAKAALNARHYEAMAAGEPDGVRSPVRDALTHFDEDGVIVLSADPTLTELLRRFEWKALFWRRRADVRHHLRFLPFGHALYEKALRPFVGMTAKALLFDVSPALIAQSMEAQRAYADRVTALHVLDAQRLLQPRELQPVPVLGIPGWWPDNEDGGFYDDVDYFRPRRAAGAAGGDVGGG